MPALLVLALALRAPSPRRFVETRRLLPDLVGAASAASGDLSGDAPRGGDLCPQHLLTPPINGESLKATQGGRDAGK